MRGAAEIADGVATFRRGAELFTRYHFGPDVARPYFEPVLAPGGARVTRAPGEVRDHPHHHGIWVGHRDAGGVDNWTELPGHGRVRHRGFDEAGGGLRERLDWVDGDDRPVLEEVRSIRVSGGRALDLELRLSAPHRDVVLGDEKDAAMVAARVAPTMQADRGGTIELAGGLRGEAACWGAAAAWCDYSGPVEDGTTAGIAILDHPANPRHPTRWHVRDYGLMCANPSGSRCFGAEADGSLPIGHGEEVRFRYRVLVHAGDAAAAGIPEAAEAFAAGAPA